MSGLHEQDAGQGADRLALGPGTRLLVIAPHPDDETLATGGLLQQALEKGAAISVFMLTHGDNNPWPQRWLEKRWQIGTDDRRRWGARRMGESRQALARLGMPDDILVSPGWPDMGLTGMLIEHGAAMRQRMTAHLDGFRPNLVILPALGDGHPDHSAAHLLTLAALAGQPGRVDCFEYLVHGKPSGAEVVSLKLGPQQLERKREAVLAYQSQVTLSRGRLLRLVTGTEHYQCLAEPAADSPAVMPWKVPAMLHGFLEVLLHGDGETWCARVPASGWIPDVLESGASGPRPRYFKLRTRWRSPWIFDHWGWRGLGRSGSE
ncbi:MAG: PIG-L family deacetylase [Rhodanobacteraceae bacterium]